MYDVHIISREEHEVIKISYQGSNARNKEIERHTRKGAVIGEIQIAE